MATTRKKPRYANIGDLLEALGGISPERICYDPPPGQATVKDLIRLNDRKEGVYELVERTLVEKPVGYGEGFLATDLMRILSRFLDQKDLGDLGGADSSMRLMSGLVRLPDLSFIRWESYPNRQRPTRAVPDLFPDLAVEALSRKNTSGEMLRKRKEYFLAGTRLVWQVDPRKRTIDVFTAPETRTTLTENDTLTGGDVLPGFSVPVAEVFARVPRTAPARRKKK